MTGRTYSEDEVLAEVVELTRPRLVAWVAARIVLPLEGPRYREVDVARLRTLVDLAEGFELPEDSLKMVISLVDQLHALRGELEALMSAVATEPEEVRLRLRERLKRS